MNDFENEILTEFIEKIDAKKASNITYYECQPTAITDYILVASVTNTIHLKSLLIEIESTTKELKKNDQYADYIYAHRISGTVDSGWCIVDLGSLIFHLMTDDVRSFYDLDAIFERNTTAFHYSP